MGPNRAVSVLLSAALLAGTAIGAPGEVSSDTGQISVSTQDALVHRQPAPDFKPTVAYQWVDRILTASGREAVRNSPRPTILSRTMALVLTSMYDAWSAYDDVAVSTRTGGRLRRPRKERTQANKEIAISFAAYRTLLFVYAEDSDWIRDEFKKLGYDPDDATTDPSRPQGIGNLAAAAVIEFRRDDGSNQQGGAKGSTSPKPYADYTGYAPKNAPDNVTDPNAWMPIPFSDGKGGTVTPGYLTPQWGMVKPFALERGDQFRPPPPAKWGSEPFQRDIEEAVAANANLTLEEKALVEFMREGPRSTGQSGHWLQFAQDVSRRDHYTLDQDVKLFFSVGNVVMDAFIACWEAKRFYDGSRPYWWARMVFKGKKVDGWVGPGKGSASIPAENWTPYSPSTFVTPPFPGYPSGHATASGAGSRMLELFTGSDAYGAVAFHSAGAMTEPGASAAEMQAKNGTPAAGLSRKDVRIDLPSFTRTAELAAQSRLLGGYHVRLDNEAGLVLGRRIAMYSWPKYQAYFDGTAGAKKAK